MMAGTIDDIKTLVAIAERNPSWNWYAIADSAQHRALPTALVHETELPRCLFGAPQGSPMAAKAPHLIALAPPQTNGEAWKWIGHNAAKLPCVTVLASPCDFNAVFAHLERFTEIRLPDGEEMFFGFWDPAILGTLVGQSDDDTLHVSGPVLDAMQRSTFLADIGAWMYWDRGGTMRSIDTVISPGEYAPTPLQLTQHQVDDLVEASVPDHVHYYVELNQPQLISDIAPANRYGLVQKAVADGREIKLEAMGDLVNFVCAALIYKERLHQDPSILTLFDRVKHGALSFAEALTKMP